MNAIIAKTIASASGTKRYPATPDSWNRGSHTAQMHRVETKVGMTIWFADGVGIVKQKYAFGEFVILLELKKFTPGK